MSQTHSSSLYELCCPSDRFLKDFQVGRAGDIEKAAEPRGTHGSTAAGSTAAGSEPLPKCRCPHCCAWTLQAAAQEAFEGAEDAGQALIKRGRNKSAGCAKRAGLQTTPLECCRRRRRRRSRAPKTPARH